MGPKTFEPMGDAKVVEPQGYIEPSFDWGKIRGTLNNAEVTTNEKGNIILGLGAKSWHAPRGGTIRFLRRGGFGAVALAIAAAVAPFQVRGLRDVATASDATSTRNRDEPAF